MSYKGRSYKDDKFGRRNYIQEQRDIAQAKIDVAEGGLIAMAVGPILMVILIAICCIFCN